MEKNFQKPSVGLMFHFYNENLKITIGAILLYFIFTFLQ
jgi:hypothetical protein